MRSLLPGMDPYLERHMTSPAHFVEIDLLRSGAPLHAREVLPRADYFVRVSRKERRPKGLVWRILLTQRLPAVSIALKSEDPDVELDLQAVLNSAYDRAGYDLEIDYRGEPVPPLAPGCAQWADRLLRDKGLR